MSDIIPFPGAIPVPEVHTERNEDEIHAEAFRDLEPKVCDLDRLAEIAVGLSYDVINKAVEPCREAELALIMAEIVRKECQQLKAGYYAAWYDEKKQPSSASQVEALQIQALRDAKRRALKLADERAKEANALRLENERLRADLVKLAELVESEP